MRAGTLQERVPPKCWFWAAAFVGFVVVSIVFRLTSVTEPNTNAFHEYNLERVEAIATNPARHKVIMLGNSRLKYATETEPELEALSRQYGVETTYLRITQDNAEFIAFGYFLESVLSMKPDIILLQDHLLVMDRNLAWNWRELQQKVVALFANKSGFWKPMEKDQKELQYGLACPKHRVGMTFEQLAASLMAERIRRTKEKGTYDINGTNAQAVREFISTANEAGIQVFALGIPKTQILNTALQDFYGEKLIAEKVLSDPAQALVFPGKISDNEYCDLIHMDTVARAEFSDWLVRTVISRLPQWELL